MGPEHYSCLFEGGLFEIYPQQKTSNCSLEFVIEVENILDIKKHISFPIVIQQKSTQIVAFDSDERIINIVQKRL
ncbi:MAG: hypothetical protein ACRYE9_01105 [Janthinobacterium lividum]